ncbi:hypothetical protein [Alteromonas phage PB15]|nr:hypothetical protein [Alteromonas phage PB15]
MSISASDSALKSAASSISAADSGVNSLGAAMLGCCCPLITMALSISPIASAINSLGVSMPPIASEANSLGVSISPIATDGKLDAPLIKPTSSAVTGLASSIGCVGFAIGADRLFVTLNCVGIAIAYAPGFSISGIGCGVSTVGALLAPLLSGVIGVGVVVVAGVSGVGAGMLASRC